MSITKLLKESQLKEAAAIIKAGGTVAFRTETVYGLGADAGNPDAVKKIYLAKARPPTNPLIIHFHSIAHLRSHFPNTPDDILRLLTRVKQALTIVLPLPEGSTIAPIALAGNKTVAVRIPACKLARKFIKLCGTPLAAPSANTSTRPSPTRWTDVYDDLNQRIDAIIMSKPSTVGLESTVVFPNNGTLSVLRQGGVNLLELSRKCNLPVELNSDETKTVRSPGTKFKHYTPSVPLVVLADPTEIRTRAEQESAVILTRTQNQKKYPGLKVIPLGKTAREVASNLFAAIRDHEKTSALIIVEAMPNTDEFSSIRERLEKAQGQG